MTEWLTDSKEWFSTLAAYVGAFLTKLGRTFLSYASVIASVASAIAAMSTAWLGWRTLGTAKAEYSDVMELKASLGMQRAVLSNAIDRVSLLGDIAAADGGDRFAYMQATKRLRDMARAGEHDSEALLQKLRFSTGRFMGSVTNNPSLEYILLEPPFEHMDVESMLKRDSSLHRLSALRHVSDLRLNKYIPDIFAALETEPDLNVVQMALHVVNATFEDNYPFPVPAALHYLDLEQCVLDYGETKRLFDEMWEASKGKVLARKPKEVRHGRDKNPPHFNMIYIYDPERPNDIPVEPSPPETSPTETATAWKN